MGLLLTAFLVFQGPTPPPAPTRDLHNGLQRSYRATVDQEGGDGFSYRLGVKVVAPKAPLGKSQETKLELKLTNYKATVEDRSVSVGKMGGGVLLLGATGLPVGLEIVGPQGPVWLPMLAFYFPATDEDGDFPIDTTPVGTGISMVGTGTLSHPDKKHPAVSFEMSFVRGEQVLGKVSLSTTLDDKGWPRKAEGTLKSADGTYHFTLAPG